MAKKNSKQSDMNHVVLAIRATEVKNRARSSREIYSRILFVADHTSIIRLELEIQVKKESNQGVTLPSFNGNVP